MKKSVSKFLAQQKFSVAFLLLSTGAFSQNQLNDSTKVNTLAEVLVSAIRSTSKTPISYTNLTKQDIAPRNLGQDIPILLKLFALIFSFKLKIIIIHKLLVKM